jgi:NAD(P)-dependent dehydrogenase (short-subunit alcohol dehydrogenase family)
MGGLNSRLDTKTHMYTVLVTGASRGLGLEFVRAYAADGWKVIATCRNPAAAIDLKAAVGDITIRALDVVRMDQIQAVAAEFRSQPIDILINNAGIYGPRGESSSFGNIDVPGWLEVIGVNAIAPLKVTEAFLPHVEASSLKTMVFISSIAGSIAERGSRSHHKRGGSYAYRSSKAALNAMVKSLGFDLSVRGVSVVALNPGWVKTDFGGGDDQAPLDPATSVVGMRQIISQSAPADNTTFRNYDGTVIPW